MSTLYATTYAKEEKRPEKKEVVFFSHADNEVKEYLLSKTGWLDSFAGFLREYEGAVGNISFGMPISIRNIPKYPAQDSFYIPIYDDTKCISVITLGIDPLGENDGYCMSMTKSFADVFNALSGGTYYFEYDAEDKAIYLVGSDTKIMVEANRYIGEYDNILTREITIEMEPNEIPVNAFDDILYTSVDNGSLNRSEVT